MQGAVGTFQRNCAVQISISDDNTSPAHGNRLPARDRKPFFFRRVKQEPRKLCALAG